MQSWNEWYWCNGQAYQSSKLKVRVRVPNAAPYGFLAPMAEQRPVKAMAAGSSPAEAANSS